MVVVLLLPLAAAVEKTSGLLSLSLFFVFFVWGIEEASASCSSWIISFADSDLQRCLSPALSCIYQGERVAVFLV